MALSVNVKDQLTNKSAIVTPFGQLVTGELDFSTGVQRNLTVANTAFNFAEPVQNTIIIIKSIIINGGRNINSSTPANLVIYGSTVSADSLTVTQTILDVDVSRGLFAPITGLNLKVDAGEWLNAKADDITVKVTIGFYRAPLQRTAT